MSEENLDVDLGTDATVYATLGDLYDEAGDVITDTISTASFTVSDPTLATVASQSGNGEATVTLLLAGVTTVSVSATTGTGAAVTGEATITATGELPTGGGGTEPGPAVTVAINLSTTDPNAPATPPVTDPATPLA